MAHKGDSAGHAESQQAFLRQLPQRLERVRRRGRRLMRHGWDINTLWLLQQEAHVLAARCTQLELSEVGAPLSALDSALHPAIEQQSAPDQDASEQIARLLEGIGALAERQHERTARPTPHETQRKGREEARANLGVPLQVTPPPEFVARFATAPPGDVAPAPAAPEPTPAAAPKAAEPAPLPARPEPTKSEAEADAAAEAFAAAYAMPPRIKHADTLAPAAEPAPEPAPAAAKPAPEPPKKTGPGAGRTVYFLSDGNALAAELGEKLSGLGFAVEMLDDADELKEVLQALAPNLVLVDSHFLPRIEDIGASLKLARGRATSRINLVAFSDSGEVTARLRAMRAGADSFIALPAPPNEVLARIQELIDAESADPFRVLIIEDDRSQALFAESILKKAGMETQVVMDPLKAIDAVEGFKPEMILMDLYMPECDGMELTALIREREQFANTPIVFLTGEHDSDKRFDALNAGGDDYLEKPIRPKYLISAVTNRVRRARQLTRRVGTTSPRDAATGLYTKGYLIDRISEVLASEESTRLGGVLFVIVDGAQSIRERGGLASFDALMQQVGATVSGMTSGSESAARFGDSSFVILCPSRVEHDLVEFGEQIRARFSKGLFEIEDKSVSLAASVGVTTFAQAWADATAVLNAAERACALARSSPDHKVRLFETQVAQTAPVDGTTLVDQIRDALKADGFQLLFQPIASLRGTTEELFQVLLRLRADGGKLYAASAVVPTAQQAGLINGVDRWVLSRCLMVIEERQKQERPLRLFVSQSTDALLDNSRAGWLRDQMAQRKISGERLVLEFRHADIVSRLKPASLFWESITPIGIKLCISGFEATMAAYQALQHLPVEFLKVAPKYIGPEGASQAARSELRQLVNHARERNIRVIAPMVEDAGTAAGLWSSGVDFIQGNFVQAATQELEFDFRASAL